MALRFGSNCRSRRKATTNCSEPGAELSKALLIPLLDDAAALDEFDTLFGHAFFGIFTHFFRDLHRAEAGAHIEQKWAILAPSCGSVSSW